MTKWFIGLGILLGSLLGVLFTDYSVSAVSNPVFTKTDELVLKKDTCEVNVSTIWGGAIMDSTSITTEQKGMWTSALDTGYWAVTQDRFGENTWSAYVHFMEGESNPTLKLDNGATQYKYYLEHSGGVGHRGIRLSLNNECELQVNWASNNMFADVSGNPGTNQPERLFNFLISTNVILDSGIDPEWVGEIQQEYTPPTPPLDWTPDVNVVNVVDWKITLQDKNFNTFDSVPFTCDQGLTPVIQYDLYNNDTDPITKIATGVFSPTIPFEFQSEKYETETEYKFIGNYYCGDDTTTFSNQTTFYFTVNAAGTYIPPTDSCYSDTFPYVDLNGCTGVMENFLNNLSFGAITFPDWSINNDSCHTLGILGDWINVPASSRTICPQFSAEIRNIVTPFLTFILGLTIVGVLLTKSRSDTH